MTTAAARHPAPLDGLAAAGAALQAGPDVGAALAAVASTVAMTLRFGTVVVNVYRPAFDEFEVLAVHGGDAVRAKLLGHRTSADEWRPLFDERFRRRGAYVVPAGSYDWDATVAYIPPGDANEDPEAWQPEDALFVALRSATGATLGVMSVDEPESGRRPCDRDLDALAAVAAQAGLVIECAQHADAAASHRAEVEHLLRVSRQLTGRTPPAEVLRAVAEAISDGLGFERVAVAVRDAEGVLQPAAVHGWPSGEIATWGSWRAGDLKAILDPALERDGCVLLRREEAHALVPQSLRGVYSSRRNGRGPHAWDHHWLLVPLHDDAGELVGVVWVDDPADRLLPSAERMRALRAFANQAASALEASRGQERLRFLAEHDPLTGLRNRRNLDELIDRALAEAGGVSLLVADVDAFKRINDDLGYETGDAVLEHIAGCLRAACPPGGVAARVGGEEFALLLPHADAAGARLVAEALRCAAGEAPAVPWGLTLSVGLATSGFELASSPALLRAATRALSAAKRLGRDRCVVYDAGTVEPLLEATARGDRRSAHHLSAVMLLAETLDLRDAGTARHSETVGRFARDLAQALGFGPEDVERMRIAGILHDIGKLSVADAILHKPGALTAEEWAEIRRHSEVGSRILLHAGLDDLATWVLHHHERWDGGGYPRGLAGDAIPLESRILAVADAYEAMTAVRPYRPNPLPPAAARAELRRHAGTQFDAAVVDAFLRIVCGE